jgi:anti-sigma regulatory factor (Ser/Thr protein kinase)
VDAHATDNELTLTFEGQPEAAPAVRTAVTSFAAAHVPAAREGDLAVVVSEVVTNAIVHGDPGGPIEVRASRAAGALRIEVTDGGPGLASTRGSTVSAPEGGFGLFLVEQLSRRWGLVRQSATTRVWFEFEVV